VIQPYHYPIHCKVRREDVIEGKGKKITIDTGLAIKKERPPVAERKKRERGTSSRRLLRYRGKPRDKKKRKGKGRIFEFTGKEGDSWQNRREKKKRKKKLSMRSWDKNHQKKKRFRDQQRGGRRRKKKRKMGKSLISSERSRNSISIRTTSAYEGGERKKKSPHSVLTREEKQTG